MSLSREREGPSHHVPSSSASRLAPNPETPVHNGHFWLPSLRTLPGPSLPSQGGKQEGEKPLLPGSPCSRETHLQPQFPDTALPRPRLALLLRSSTPPPWQEVRETNASSLKIKLQA